MPHQRHNTAIGLAQRGPQHANGNIGSWFVGLHFRKISIY
jgi:hypothetical protein